MMHPVPIAPGIEWTGVLDPQLRVFDVIMRAEHGTTYNAYVVKGSEKIALIETSKGKFTDTFLTTLEQSVDPANIDYVVLNHMEPDHSGALERLLDRAPGATILCTKPGLMLAREIANRDLPARTVSDGETVSLGDKTLRFIIAPNLHWPDTMFTYVEEESVLFPCDFLGAHYCDDRLFDDLIDNYDYAFSYYFMAIMRPFKEFVRAGLEKIRDLDLKIVCPSHGPIIRKNVDSCLKRYTEWSRTDEREVKRLLVFYVSVYGNTEKLAEMISEGARDAGLESTLFDLVGVDMHLMADQIENADGIAIGTCTINADALPQVWELLSSAHTIKLKGKVGGSFGSYGWSGEGPKMVAERLKGLKLKLPQDPLRVKLVPTEEDLEAARGFGRKLAEAL